MTNNRAIANTARGQVEYEQLGEAPFVVVMHGTPGSYRRTFIQDNLLDAGFGTISPSRPGYQGTPLTSGSTMPEQADAIAALLDELNVGPVGVYGISGGGPSSIEMAARHPDKVRALMLECAISIKFEIPVSPAVAAMVSNGFFMWLSQKMSHWAPRVWVKQLISTESTFSKDEVDRVAEDILAAPEKVELLRTFTATLPPSKHYKAGFKNDLEHFTTLDGSPFESVRCPTFVAHGTHDGDVPFEHGETSANNIAGAELCAVDKGFHLLALDAGADELLQAQVAFWQRNLAA